jgi:transcriptional regulator with XRE-family HTH domain
MKFNEKLLELRKKEGLSQEELADKVDVSRQTVSKWEAGQTTPEMEKLIRLSEIFKVSVDELAGKEIKKEEPKENGKVKAKKKHPLLRLFLIIVIIYFVISLYKFIALTLINDIGQSFYEESYSITEKVESYDNSISLDPNVTELYIIKIKNRLIKRLYDRNGRADNPFDITYVEIEKKQASNFRFDQEKQKYIVSDRLAGLSEEEKA